MGLFKSVFGGGDSVTSAILKSQKRIFRIYSVSRPTDEQKFKTYFYLLIFGIVVLDDIGGSDMKEQMGELYGKTSELMKPLRVQVDKLANDTEQFDKIIQNFPSEQPIDGSRTVDGLSAFHGMYSAAARDTRNYIMENSQGPTQYFGPAAKVLCNSVFGEGKAEENFMEISTEMMDFAKDLMDSL